MLNKSFDRKRARKTKQELVIEKKLKFFVMSVAFNGSDGHKLPSLNDLYEDSVITKEDPCNLLDKKARYPCEPTPLRVSACLMRSMTKQNDTPPPKSYRTLSSRRRNTQRRNNTSVVVTGRHSKENSTTTVKAPGKVEPHVLKQDHSQILDEINKLFQNNSAQKNVSVLKQLLLRSASEQQTTAYNQANQRRPPSVIKEENKNVGIGNDEVKKTESLRETVWKNSKDQESDKLIETEEESVEMKVVSEEEVKNQIETPENENQEDELSMENDGMQD